MEQEPKIEKEPSLQEKLEKAKQFLEKAKISTGRDRVNAVFGCEGICIHAGLSPKDLEKIGTTREELDELIMQGDKEEAKEFLEKARSSKGRGKISAAEECKFLLEAEASKWKEIKTFTPEDIGTTLEELDELISQGEKEEL